MFPFRLLRRDHCSLASLVHRRLGSAATTNYSRTFQRDFSKDSSSSSFTTDPELAGLFKNPIVQELWKARQEAKKKSRKGTKRDANVDTVKKEGGLHGKRPQDSRVQVTYHFSTDKHLLEAYRSPWGQMRLGRLMEDLDALAGNIAYFHVEGGEKSTEDDYVHPTIVTASVDRIRLRHRPSVGLDQHLSGQVTWTGTSSMEIRMQCTTDGETEPWLEAYVTFVTLNPTTKKPMPIHPLLPETAEEQAEFEAGDKRAALRKERRKSQKGGGGSSLMNEQLANMANQLLTEAGPLLNMPSLADPHSILMQQTKIQNAQIAQPQVQNLHNRVFGGFLVRRAFELSFANAYLFGGALPVFLEVDEVSFWSPVDVGDLLVFNSRVLYTERGYLRDYYCRGSTADKSQEEEREEEELPIVHVEVEAWVAEPEKATARLSNQFYFTFAVNRQVRKVLPSNIDEARRMASRILGDQEQHGLDKTNP